MNKTYDYYFDFGSLASYLSVFEWFETDGLISQRRDWLIGFKPFEDGQVYRCERINRVEKRHACLRGEPKS